MKIIKEIFGRFFALWAMSWFVVSMIVIFIPVWATRFEKEPRRTIYVFRIFKVWMAFWFFMAGVRRIFRGRHHFREGENYVVVCNHNSFMDVPLCSPGIPGANKTIAKVEMASIPLFGVIYQRGSVLVDRKSEESRKLSYSKMKDVLSIGLHMCIYPEGTRNKSNLPLQRFHDGAFRLAMETGKAVMPSLIFYTKKVLPPRKLFFFWPHRVEMHFLPPVPVQGFTDSTALREQVHAIMSDYYREKMDQ